MPATKSAYKRYRIIDACLTNKLRPFPTLEDIADKCSDVLGQVFSLSTIEKDIRSMKEPERLGGFDAPIVYNKLHKGYAYAEQGFSISGLSLQPEEWNSLRYAAKLLYQYADVPIFKDFKQAIEKIDARFSFDFNTDESIPKLIGFETANATTGYEWLADLYAAIKNNCIVEIVYENIYKNTTKTYRLIPYYLKEHRNRWYVIGWVNERDAYLTFALDRIQQITHTGTFEKKRQDFTPDHFFYSSIGIMKVTDKTQRVVLQINHPYNKLLALDPLHKTQKIIKSSRDVITIEIKVNINQELFSKILSLSPYCKILQPLSLAKIIRSLLQQSLNQY